MLRPPNESSRDHTAPRTGVRLRSAILLLRCTLSSSSQEASTRTKLHKTAPLHSTIDQSAWQLQAIRCDDLPGRSVKDPACVRQRPESLDWAPQAPVLRGGEVGARVAKEAPDMRWAWCWRSRERASTGLRLAVPLSGCVPSVRGFLEKPRYSRKRRGWLSTNPMRGWHRKRCAASSHRQGIMGRALSGP